MAEYIEREALKQSIRMIPRTPHPELLFHSSVQKVISNAPVADVVEVDKVAELLCVSFGSDTCACNFNGNDEWLWEKCKYNETECPTPKDELGCWKEYVKAMLAKMDGKDGAE